MGKKILLVDDERDFLTLMGERIRTWGYDLIEASSGKEAIDAVKSKNAEAVILDYVMPDMDGIATLKEIRKLDNKIPVIMLTAHPDEKSIAGTEKLGVSAFIPKLSAHSDAQANLKTALDMALKQKG